MEGGGDILLRKRGGRRVGKRVDAPPGLKTERGEDVRFIVGPWAFTEGEGDGSPGSAPPREPCGDGPRPANSSPVRTPYGSRPVPVKRSDELADQVQRRSTRDPSRPDRAAVTPWTRPTARANGAAALARRRLRDQVVLVPFREGRAPAAARRTPAEGPARPRDGPADPAPRSPSPSALSQGSSEMNTRDWTALVGAIFLLAPAAGTAQQLGSVHFPTSGTPEAQPHFEAGLLLLHSFEYEDAAARFRRAREIDPDFAMAYWGEAQTHNHPIWMRQNRDAALAVLERYAPASRERLAKVPTPRERDWIETVEILYGEGTKKTRDFRYRDAMRRLADKYPDDHEATALYALSLLGTAHDGRDFAIYMKAAAAAQRVFEENPNHPGAAHYIIHAFDDPIHAPLGLPAARVYSRIAPDASHAQHMTSHIFVAMGLWEEVVAANARARDMQDAGLARKGRRPNRCGHYTSWLHYGYLQLGRLKEAAAGMAACQERVGDAPSRSEAAYFVRMRARAVIDAADWTRAGALSADLAAFPGLEFSHDFVDAFAAVRTGDLERARRLRSRHGDAGDQSDPRRGILLLELDGLLALAAGDREGGVALLEEAARQEEGLPYEFGPPATLMPPHELLATELAALGRHEEARRAWEEQLARTPKRTQALLGLARAAMALGDEVAAREAYAALAETWAGADDEVSGLGEARGGGGAR